LQRLEITVEEVDVPGIELDLDLGLGGGGSRHISLHAGPRNHCPIDA